MKGPGLLRKLRQSWKRRRFRRSGMKPWTSGYIEYKLHHIEGLLANPPFPSGDLPEGYGFRLDERVIEYPWLFSRLEAGPERLLDAGSVLNFRFLVDHPRLREKKIHICTLAPEAECFWRSGISYLYEDLRELPYRDGWFDSVVCISTLEHVGMDNTLLYTRDAGKNESRPLDYLAAFSELKRVLKPGGRLYLTVPFGRPHPHRWLQVFDQTMIENLLAHFGGGRKSAEYFLYKPSGWKRSTAGEAASAEFFDIHHAPTYDADFAASARAVCCLDLTKEK